MTRYDHWANAILHTLGDIEPYSHERDVYDRLATQPYIHPAEEELSFNRYAPISSERETDFTKHPPPPTPPCEPWRARPVYQSANDPDVHRIFHELDVLTLRRLPHHRPLCSDAAFALAALRVFDYPKDNTFSFFWGAARRCATAALVQRVLNSEHLILPVNWKGEAAALAALTAREEEAARRVARLKRKAAGGDNAHEALQKVRRVTRAQAARQTAQPIEDASTPPSPPSSSHSTPAPTDAAERTRKPRRPPPAPAPVAPHRVSARQREHRTHVPAQQQSPTASVPARTRARSEESSESNETVVASTSSAASRAASITSADTIVVDVEISVRCTDMDRKGKGRLIVPAREEENVAPMASEPASTGMVTRSRTKTGPGGADKEIRGTPYPATTVAQVAAGRGPGKTHRTATGKRKSRR
ncbi:hypothetical protein GGX14DRAFT_438910 [Mycena pura]|uniref:Uncharacterized protein n=1 Tax=Mycena pura TaxID=153505 RepID=A0AAD6VRY4_9AGAR|nr:hypothetical protein GGX14DRAFT_438910 [Mycena pura]